MQFNSLSEFIAMGGYGFFVWLSYGACAVIMLGMLFASKRAHKNILKEVKAQIEREARIKNAKEQGL